MQSVRYKNKMWKLDSFSDVVFRLPIAEFPTKPRGKLTETKILFCFAFFLLLKNDSILSVRQQKMFSHKKTSTSHSSSSDHNQEHHEPEVIHKPYPCVVSLVANFELPTLLREKIWNHLEKHVPHQVFLEFFELPPNGIYTKGSCERALRVSFRYECGNRPNDAGTQIVKGMKDIIEGDMAVKLERVVVVASQSYGDSVSYVPF